MNSRSLLAVHFPFCSFSHTKYFFIYKGSLKHEIIHRACRKSHKKLLQFDVVDDENEEEREILQIRRIMRLWRDKKNHFEYKKLCNWWQFKILSWRQFDDAREQCCKIKKEFLQSISITTMKNNFLWLSPSFFYLQMLMNL